MPSMDHSTPALPFRPPWDVSLPERMRMLASGRSSVAYFYEKVDDSTFRYRIYNMTQVLNSPGDDVSASYFFLEDLHRLQDIADLADLLVICRARYDQRVNHLINAFRCRGKRVLFDVDDLVFDTDYGHLIQRTLDQDLERAEVWDHWFAYSSRIGTTLRLCDAAITTNEYLAERISEYACLPVRVIPNFLNREQLEVSEPLFAARRNGSPSSDLIRLGYFSGSPSHNRDFAMVTSALEELLEEDSRLGLTVVGYITLGADLARFGDRVRYCAFTDFVSLQRLVGGVEFNLVPLQYNAFTNCKSELKYFEAAIVGTQTIASPTFTYRRAIRHADNGYLAQAHQWAHCIRQAVATMERDYDRMADLAYGEVRQKYAWFNQREAILEAVGLS